MAGSCGNEEVLTGQNISPRYAVADEPGCRAHNSGVVGWDCIKSKSRLGDGASRGRKAAYNLPLLEYERNDCQE